MKKDIRNHPYHFEQALQRQSLQKNNNINDKNIDTYHFKQQQQQQSYHHLDIKNSNSKNTTYFTWLVFMNTKWVPFDSQNQGKLEQTLHLGGTFVDIEDSNFPKVKRVRVFPKSNYLSYLGVKFRLSRVMQPDAWIDSRQLPSKITHHHTSMLNNNNDNHSNNIDHPSSISSSHLVSTNNSNINMDHYIFKDTLTRYLPLSIRNHSILPPTPSTNTTSSNSMDHHHWKSNSSNGSHLISHVLS